MLPSDHAGGNLSTDARKKRVRASSMDDVV